MNTNDLINTFTDLKSKKESLDRTLLSKETEYKTLKSQYDNLLQEACTKYNVHSLEELEVLLNNQTTELEALLKKAQEIVSVLSPSSSIDLSI